MPLSTEIYVMIIFITGASFFYFILRDSNLAGRHFFMLSYIFLTLSNIFTVVEEFFLNTFFNALEHLFITLSAATMLFGIIKLTSRNNQHGTSTPQKDVKD